MLDATAALLTYQAASYFATGVAPRRMGNRHPTIVPYETFAASDGDFVLAVGNDGLWRRFCRRCGLDAARRGSAIHDQPAARPALRRAEADDRRRGCASRTRAEWIAALTAAGVPCGSVRDIGEVLRRPAARRAGHDRRRSSTPRSARLQLLGVPIKLSDTPGGVRTAPPTLGQHTEAILRDDVGLDADSIAALRAEEVI